MNKKKKEHLGISMNFFIYHPRKSLTSKDVEKFSNKMIKIVEKNGWYMGGGYRLAYVDKPDFPYIDITPKHIIQQDLDE
jgi:hypothetical protein